MKVGVIRFSEKNFHRKLFLTALFSLLTTAFLSQAALASTTVELLTGQPEETWGGFPNNSSNPQDPFNTWWTNSRAQSVYLASDLKDAGMQAGTITSLHLKCFLEPGRPNLKDMRIHIKHTSDSTSTAWKGDISDPAGNWTLVYGPEDINPTAEQWYEFELHTPFEWDGQSNIMLDINRDDTAFFAGGGMYVRTGLASRTYSGREDFVDWTHPLGAHQTNNHVPNLKITFTPLRLPVIALDKTSLTFATTEGTNPSDRSFKISNSGERFSNLNWIATPTEPWLEITPSSGTLKRGRAATADVSVNASAPVLSTGTYTAEIIFSDSEANISTKTISVTLLVRVPLPAIKLSNEKVAFAAVEEGETPGPQRITITNQGNPLTQLNWQAKVDNAPWLSLSHSSGTLAYIENEYIELTVDMTGYKHGKKEAVITVSDPDSRNKKEKITVVLSILAADRGEALIRGGERGYVNPSEGEKAQIIFKANRAGRVTVKVFDRLGRLVWEDSKNTSGGNDSIEWACVNASNNVVSSGVYAVHIKGPGIDTVKQIAVVK